MGTLEDPELAAETANSLGGTGVITGGRQKGEYLSLPAVVIFLSGAG